MTRQDKTKQDTRTTRIGWEKQDKKRQHITTQYNATQRKQHNTTQYKQDKTRQDNRRRQASTTQYNTKQDDER
jgi:hypothetical protein